MQVLRARAARWLAGLVLGAILPAPAVPVPSCGLPIAAGQPWPADERARERWQRVGDIFEWMQVAEGSAVADIGAGGGFFTVRLARAVGPSGRVYAVDVSERVVGDLRERMEKEGLPQVEVIQGRQADPGLPDEALDAVLIVNAYHEMTRHVEMLVAIRRALKPGGRLVLVEPAPADRTETRRSQTGRHVIAIEIAERELVEGGFDVIERQERFADRPGRRDEWLLVAAKGQ